MLDTLCADQQIGKLLNQLRFAFHNDNFETGVMIEVGVHRGDDLPMVLMLDLGQFLRQQAAMVVINQCDRADDLGIWCVNRGRHQAIADKVAQRLRAVSIPLALDKPVESLQELRVN